MTKHSASRARRPLGVSIALLATAVGYGLRPLGEIYLLRRIDATADEAFILGGVDIDFWLWAQGFFGGLILVVCLLAWLGRPPQIRMVLIGLLFLLTGLHLFRIVEAWITPADPLFGGQAQEAIRNYLRCELPVMVLVPLYVIWYFNRAPARAFFRRVPLNSLAQAEAKPETDVKSDE